MLNFRPFFACLLISAAISYPTACHADLPVLTVLHTFAPNTSVNPAFVQDESADAGRSEGVLTQGVDGAFYGISPLGGAHGTGSIFKINSDGTGFILLHSFGQLDMPSSYPDNADGAGPKGALVEVTDGTLFGTAEFGGPDGAGVVFKLNQDGSGFSIVHTFDPIRHSEGGAYPKGLTQGNDGMIYGITLTGGNKNGNGVLFQMSQDGKVFHALNSFHPLFSVYNSELTGLNPSAAVTIGYDSAFYGTTSGGGSEGSGDIYKIDASGKHFFVLHSFPKDKGKMESSIFSQGPLVIGPDNFLYGCTRRGGTSGGGMVYKIGTDGTGFKVLHNFSAPDSENGDGTFPDGPLTLGHDGNLYGLTSRGGAGEAGILFRINLSGTRFFALHDFSLPTHSLYNADGGLAFMGLTLGHDGYLYGFSTGGGAYGSGTIFQVVLPASK